jgi:hypothetical protein
MQKLILVCGVFFGMVILNLSVYAASNKTTGIVLIDETPMPELSEEQKSKGYVVFIRNYLDLVYPASIPKKDELRTALESFATPGEFEPITFSIRSLRELKGLKVIVSDLINADGQRIKKKNIDVRVVSCLNKIFEHSTPCILSVPAYLSSFNMIDIPQNITTRFWLTTKIPPDQPAGIYQGDIKIMMNEAEPTTINIRLQVLPFRLLEPKGISWGVYYIVQYKSYSQIIRELKDMKEHGMTSVGLYSGPSKLFGERLENYISYNKKKVRLNFPDGFSKDSWFIWFVKAYKKLGFSEPICTIDEPAKFYVLSKYPLGSDKFATLYKATMKAFTSEIKRRGWPEIIWELVDEAQTDEQIAEAKRLTKLHNEIKIPALITGWGRLLQEVGPYANYLNYNGRLPKEEEILNAHQKGKKVWYYNNDESGCQPEIMRYGAGFLLWKSKADGMFNWEYSGVAKGSFYDDLDGRDFIASYYPPDGKRTGGPTPGWEGFREGVDDYKYLFTLSEVIKQAKNSMNQEVRTKTIKVEEQFHQLIDTIYFHHNLRNSAHWRSKKTLLDGQESFHGPLKIENGWNFESYQDARWRIAQLIMQLKDYMYQGQ